MTGKHFDLDWLDGTKPYETFLNDPSTNEEGNEVVRIGGVETVVSDLVAVQGPTDIRRSS